MRLRTEDIPRGAQTDERRQYQRTYGPFRGTWQSASEHRHVGILDIAPDGCFVDGIAGPEPGERVQVSVTIQHCSVSLAGTVILTDRVQGFAVAFTITHPRGSNTCVTSWTRRECPRSGSPSDTRNRKSTRSIPVRPTMASGTFQVQAQER